MRFAFLFTLLALGLTYLALTHGNYYWLLLWPALSFLLVGVAYACSSPRLFGKRTDGTTAGWALALLLPYLLYCWSVWRLVRWFHRLHSSEPYASQITPTLWVSRRVLAREIPPGIVCIVDMTCEFPAAPGVTSAVPCYLCLPTLDYGIPPMAQIAALLEKLRTLQGPILIHCAQGHGRSALIAALHLLATRVATSPDEAFRLIKRTRPNARLSRRQRAVLWSTHAPLRDGPGGAA